VPVTSSVLREQRLRYRPCPFWSTVIVLLPTGRPPAKVEVRARGGLKILKKPAATDSCEVEALVNDANALETRFEH